MDNREKLAELLEEARLKYHIRMKEFPDKYNAIEWHDYFADHLIKNNVIILPCRKGDPVYQIKKFCDENTGCYEFYRPTKEFDKPCQYYEETWDGTICHYPGLDFDEKWYCNLDCDIYCDVCKERFAVQADRFSYGMLEHIYNTPMFDKTLSLENIFFLTKEEAEDALDKYLKGEWPNG